MRNIAALILLIAVLAGCMPVDPPLDVMHGEPIAQQLLQAAPWLRDARFSTLMDFETSDDVVFVTTLNHSEAATHDRAFTGHGSLLLRSDTPRFAIKLASLLAGRPFPGDWDLVGGYFYSNQHAMIAVRLGSETATQRVNKFELKPGVWTPVFIDLPTTIEGEPRLILNFELDSPHGTVWCDDVMLVHNEKQLIGDGASVSDHSESTWQVMRKGTQLSGGVIGAFHFSLSNFDVSPTGWTCDEANGLRARFHSPEDKTLTVYSDGRAFWNGEYKPMSAPVRDPSYGNQNRSPATLEIEDNIGRVDRNTPGDANNDGYNETTGSYRIAANGARLEVRFVPAKGVPDPRPVLEISGMSFGKILATLEGRLIEGVQRTADGHILVELPATIDRPATVDVRIEN